MNITIGGQKIDLLGRWFGNAATPGRKRTTANFQEPIQKTETALWHETINPLRFLTADKAQLIFDRARLGCYADISWIYQEMESADPTLMVCAERRAAGVQETDWLIKQKQSSRMGKLFDEKLADEQQAFLEEAYGACEGSNEPNAQTQTGSGLIDGIEWMSSAFFRGFAHAVPRYSPDGQRLLAIESLDQWNFVRERTTGRWLWNPNALAVVYGTDLQEVPSDELITLVRTRHIDYPALAVFIRNALGEKQWGIFMERYGIPPVMIIMPEFAEASDEAIYMDAANKVALGGRGALPNGCTVEYATEARGTDPWTQFLKHQQELVVLLATGGLYTSLGGATGLGKGASEEHAETWRSIVRRDSRIIAGAFNRRCTTDLLNAGFPDKPHLVEFAFETESAPKPGDVFADGEIAVKAGYRIVQSDLESRTGYTLEPVSATTSDPSDQPDPSDPADLNAPSAANKSTGDRQVALSSEDLATAAMDALATARRRHLAPIIDRLLDALAETDPQALRNSLAKLLQDLPAFVTQLQVPQADVDLMQRILTDAVNSGVRVTGRSPQVKEVPS